MSAPELMTKGEVAAYLRVSIRTIDRRMESGDIPHVKNGRLVRFRREDVEACSRPSIVTPKTVR